jgi:hypothetical protein
MFHVGRDEKFSWRLGGRLHVMVGVKAGTGELKKRMNQNCIL